MKKVTIVCSAFFALSATADLWVQTRGPRYNPGRSSGSSSGSSSRSSSPSRSSGSSSSSRGPHYNPSPSRSSSSSSSSRGSHYNPSPSRSSSSSSSTSSRPSSPSSNPGPRYNPNPGSSTGSTGSVSVPQGPRYNPAPSAPRYEAPRHQRPGHILVRREFNHIPHSVAVGPIRYQSPRDYYTLVNRRFIFRRWVQEPVVFSYSNGYWEIGGYPYYVYRGFRYRYNPVEMCQYELVDGNDYTTVKTYPVQACTVAYDQCAVERDTMNHTIGQERYFCAEAVDKDQEVKEEEYSAQPVEMDEAKKAAIAAYLDDMDYKDIFRDGGVNNCHVVKIGGLFSSGNDFGCKYIVKVGDKVFPEADESVCSEGSQAALIGCDVGNEKENTGCILQQAIQQGYCH